jgi:biofilm protein TabA
MIVAKLERAAEQTAPSPEFKKAYKFLLDARGRELPEGRVEIDGDKVFAIVQSYETKSDAEPKFEAHRKYADIQYIIDGEELIGWAPLEKMKMTQDYDPAKDVTLGVAAPRDTIGVKLFAGELGVFYPSDAHAPKQAVGKGVKVHKIVVKVAV